MNLSVARRESSVPQCADGTCGSAVAKVAAPQATAPQSTIDKVFTAAYAAGAIGGVVVTVGALAAFAGVLATGIYDQSHGTQLSASLLAHQGTFETVMKGGTWFIGACAAVMGGTIIAHGISQLAARFRRA